MLSFKNLLRILIDLLLLTGALLLATFIRIEGDFEDPTFSFIWEQQLSNILPAILGLQFLSLILMGTYRRFWRYTDVDEIIHLTKALLPASLIILIPRFMGQSPAASDLWAVSYGVNFIDFLLSITLLSGVRLLRSYLVDQKNIKKRLLRLEDNVPSKPSLVIGAGEAAIQLIRTIDQHPELNLKVIAALDDDKKKHGMLLVQGVEVKGYIKDLQYWVDELAIEQVIIAIPSAKPHIRREISRLCSASGVDVRTIPGVDQLAGGQVTVEHIRKLSMEDLLGREEVDLNVPEVLAYLQGKRVLITGAGGSIGSEICRQLLRKCHVESMCLLGKGENSVFSTLQEMLSMRGQLNDHGEEIRTDFIAKIADIRNIQRMGTIIQEFQPHVIFHAAAHKHVHLMQLNPCEAFENNVLGTRNIARLAGENKVETFVFVSTDKSVNPTGVMGASKNLAEKVVLLAAKEFPKSKYTTVRFGNVLGSRGSVITVWEKQLMNSQPLTVTHKDVIRYFMTIPEAAGLVIQAGAKAQTGEIMVLDMGEPIKIYELAQQFIQLAGTNAEGTEIKITGLKQGEKLYEELLTDGEFVDSQLTDKIYKAKLNFNLDAEELGLAIGELAKLAESNQGDSVREKIFDCIKNFTKA